MSCSPPVSCFTVYDVVNVGANRKPVKVQFVARHSKRDGRSRLNRDLVLRAAVELGDEGGLEALSMRKLGLQLGVEAMALYRHVRHKDDLLDGVVEAIVGEIRTSPPATGDDWKAALRTQILDARAVMLRHPWARRVLEDRGVGGPATSPTSSPCWRSSGRRLLGRPGPPRAPRLGSRILGFNQTSSRTRRRTRDRPPPEDDPIRSGKLASVYPRIRARDPGTHDCVWRVRRRLRVRLRLDLILDGLERAAS